MNCNTCAHARPINYCFDRLIIGKVDTEAEEVYVTFTNLATERTTKARATLVYDQVIVSVDLDPGVYQITVDDHLFTPMQYDGSSASDYVPVDCVIVRLAKWTTSDGHLEKSDDQFIVINTYNP